MPQWSAPKNRTNRSCLRPTCTKTRMACSKSASLYLNSSPVSTRFHRTWSNPLVWSASNRATWRASNTISPGRNSNLLSRTHWSKHNQRPRVVSSWLRREYLARICHVASRFHRTCATTPRQFNSKNSPASASSLISIMLKGSANKWLLKCKKRQMQL